MPRSNPRPGGLPTKQQVLEFVNASASPVGKREIARAFGVKREARAALRELLRELQDEGALPRGRRHRGAQGTLPRVTMIEAASIDADGEMLCRPVDWAPEVAAPVIYLAADRQHTAAPPVGTRILARLTELSPGVYEARAIRVFEAQPNVVVGLVEAEGRGVVITSISRKESFRYAVAGDLKGAAVGDAVVAEMLPGPRGRSAQVRVVERIGRMDDPSNYSLIAAYSRDIPVAFSPEAEAEAEAAQPVDLSHREDLRDLPLVTIDGADARDFDDAVWAAPLPAGEAVDRAVWRVVVAIADVSWYVRPGSALDRDAYERGTSVYFPDRVVPMLPPRLSNGLCSLRPGEDRACIAADMRIAADGRIVSARFLRGLMRSAARLTYEQVQAGRDGNPDHALRPLMETVIAPLYGAFATLAKARAQRGTLDLDVAETKIALDDDGRVSGVFPRTTLASHRLIEEFMITANVAAAETLEGRSAPVMYRVHEPPPLDKLEGLRESLQTLGYRLIKGGAVRPAHFKGILEKAQGTDEGPLINALVLRSMSKAVYSPRNAGHFGLALERYCHFTSPIRRYPDLLVHRALVGAIGLGPGSLPNDWEGRAEEAGEACSIRERRAEAAERECIERYVTLYLADRVGADFPARVSGVTRFGLFVTLDGVGADGLVPIRTLPSDYYEHDETHHTLVGRDSGRGYRLAQRVRVTLMEADTHSGGLLFTLADGEKQTVELARPARSGQRGRPGPHGPKRSFRRKGR